MKGARRHNELTKPWIHDNSPPFPHKSNAAATSLVQRWKPVEGYGENDWKHTSDKDFVNQVRKDESLEGTRSQRTTHAHVANHAR
jgi:hypothetical protein